MRRITALFLLLALLLTGCGITVEYPGSLTSNAGLPDADTLQVHFIDVGQADCMLLECGGEFLLIDGGNVDDSSMVVTYLENQGVEELAAVICTHAHEDHVGGLPAVLAVYPTQAVYAPTTTYSSRCFDDFMYYVNQQGLTVQLPVPGDTISLGSATATILGPVKAYPDANNTSIILRVEFGDTAFVFTGDMEKEAESDMLNYWEDRVDWQSDVLKAGHHGSSTSTSYRFLDQVDPDYAVISCGKDNSYGHPHQETISLLRGAGVSIFRTDRLGTILAVSDGKEVTFTWENQQAVPDNAEQADTIYIGNVNSGKFHLPTCTGLPAEQNQIVFSSYREAMDAGYSPCSHCLG